MARHRSHRSKPKKRPNRYNPNAPSYSAVHGNYFSRPIARSLIAPQLFRLNLFGMARRSG